MLRTGFTEVDLADEDQNPEYKRVQAYHLIVVTTTLFVEPDKHEAAATDARVISRYGPHTEPTGDDSICSITPCFHDIDADVAALTDLSCNSAIFSGKRWTQRG